MSMELIYKTFTHFHFLRPTDLLKSKLREEFAEREKRMERVDAMIEETILEFCDSSSTSTISSSSSVSLSLAPDSMTELRRTPRSSHDNLICINGGQYFEYAKIIFKKV